MDVLVRVMMLVTVLEVRVANLAAMERLCMLLMHRLFDDEVHWLIVVAMRIITTRLDNLIPALVVVGFLLYLDSVVLRLLMGILVLRGAIMITLAMVGMLK